MASIFSRALGSNVEDRMLYNGVGIPDEPLLKLKTVNPTFDDQVGGRRYRARLSDSQDIALRGQGGTIRAESHSESTTLIVAAPLESA